MKSRSPDPAQGTHLFVPSPLQMVQLFDDFFGPLLVSLLLANKDVMRRAFLWHEGQSLSNIPVFREAVVSVLHRYYFDEWNSFRISKVPFGNGWIKINCNIFIVRKLKKCVQSIVKTDDASQLQLTTLNKTQSIVVITNHDLQCATPDLLTLLCSIVMTLLVQ